MQSTQRELTFTLTLIFSLFFIPLSPALAEQLHINELLEANPPNQILKDGPIVRQKPEEVEEEDTFPEPRYKVALTFDDGPDPRHTPQILDILKAEDVLATFFVLGEKVERYPEIVRRMFAEGHLLANHSRTHVDFAELANEDILSLELIPTSQAIENITSQYPLIMRPPYGSLRVDSVNFLRQRGWRIVRWSLDTFDWDTSRNRPEQILSRIKKHHHPGAIVLMHCNGPATTNVLPDVIRTLRELGYEFVTVTQL